MSDIAQRLSTVREQIADALRRAGRAPGSVTLVAVSKQISEHAVLEAIHAGQRCFGENYVQEAQEKFTTIRDNGNSFFLDGNTALSLHLIGPLQSNKVKRAVGVFTVLQTISSTKTIRLVSAEAEKKKINQQVLIQVNISGEDTKSGCAPSDVEELINVAQDLHGVSVTGLMSIGTPLSAEFEIVNRREFARLRALRDELENKCGVRLPDLSMGMSGDYVEAIEEGATIVRVGSAIFGDRPGA